MSYLNLISFFGIFGLGGLAWLVSENRRLIVWRTIAWGVGLQLILGFFIFRFPWTRQLLEGVGRLFDGLFSAADAGARFLFGAALVPSPTAAASAPMNLGYVFALRALPSVVFFSGLAALLYHLGIIQLMIRFFAKIFYPTTGISGVEALSGTANIFTGIEAVIAIKPFLAGLTRSELCAILACCFGTSASSTWVIYVSSLKDVFPNIFIHLISASLLAIPACFVLSKIVVPERELPLTASGLPANLPTASFADPKAATSPRRDPADRPTHAPTALEAAMGGAIDGLKMAALIAATLILVVGLVSLLDQAFQALAQLPDPLGGIFQVVTLANLEGVVFWPLTLLTGVAWDDSWDAAVLVGRRLLETAIPPYQSLAELRQQGVISQRTLILVAYALSGFAHLPSLGIFVGGTSALMPARRREITQLGWKALLIGTLATLMIAAVAGVWDDGSLSLVGDKPLNPATPADPLRTTPPPAVPSPAPSVQ